MKSRKLQSGVMLLEALIGLLIFAVGVLGLIGMQAAATKATGDAKFRAEATMFAEQLIGQMWADNRASLSADYAGSSGSGGAKYQAWVADVTAAGTGLPGAGKVGNKPTVAVDASNTVTITIKWQLPSESFAHSYVTIARVTG
jgi:type IV pilus assembly protein PilV